MITSLAALNDAVTVAANYIAQTVCTQTKDGSFRLALNDIDCSHLPHYISEEDLYAYGDFIAGELAGRKEFETIDYHDHEFSGECKREYCPNLEDRWPEEPVLPVAQPLSMTELSEIGETAIAALRGANLSSLRETLGMDFQQVRRLGLSDQDHFFSVETPGSDKPFWAEDIESILHHMRKQCEIGTQSRLYYNEIDHNNEIMRLPMAEENCGRIVTIPASAEFRPKNPEYAEIAQRMEGAAYDLPRGYSLSYSISGPNMADRTPLTLQDAVTQFAEAAENSSSPVLTAYLKSPSGKMRSEAVILTQKYVRTSMNAHTVPDSSFQPHRGTFYSDLARLAFPDRVLDIDRWRIKVIAPGETYGRGNHLVNEDSKPLVEFRDMDGASSHSPDGVLVSSCPLDVLLGDEQGRGGIQPGQGLNLYDSVESWTLSADEMAPVLTWLRLKEVELSKEKIPGLNRRIQNAKDRSTAQDTSFSLHPHKQQEH